MSKKDYYFKNDLAILKKGLKKGLFYKYNQLLVKNYIANNYNYTNIIFKNIENKEIKKDLIKILSQELKLYLNKYKLTFKHSCLVVGLGNKNIISDSLGPQVIDKIYATGYLNSLNIPNKYRRVYTYIPNTLKETGFMAFVGLKALIKELNPDFIIIIDSLVSGSIKYLNQLIQITDMGITPGSGLSNYSEEISMNTLNIPVIVIGVPTVIEASTIIKDVLNTTKNKFNFKDGYDLIVTTKDIDGTVPILSEVIGQSINKTLNKINISK